METTHQVEGLGQVGLCVSDVAAATAFYRDVLGLPFLFAPHPGLAFLQAGATRIMLSLPEEGVSTSNSILYYLVPSVDASYAALEGKAEFIDKPHLIAKMPDHELWMVFLKDPDGNSVGLMEERR